jgi:hypothetical protein
VLWLHVISFMADFISLDNCVSPASPTPGIAGSRAVAAGAGVLMSCHIEPDINYLLYIYIIYIYHIIYIMSYLYHIN